MKNDNSDRYQLLLKSTFYKSWKIHLSQFWTPCDLNNHKVSFGSMIKRVASHFDPNTITFNTKCDQILTPWTYLPYFGGNHASYSENIDLKTHFWSILRVSVSETCRIDGPFMRKPNSGVTGTIHLCVPYRFVRYQLVGYLVELPVEWSFYCFLSQTRSRGLQTTFQASVRTYSSPRTVWTHKIQNIHHHLA